MKKQLKRIVSVALLVSMTYMTTSCIGGFRLFNNVIKWNKSMSKEPFINEIVFLILWIVPVYEIVMLGDLFIFNSIEFWSGHNVITMKEGDIIEKSVFHNDQEYYVRATNGRVEITPKDKETIILNYDKSTSIWSAVSNGQIIELNEQNLKYIPLQVSASM